MAINFLLFMTNIIMIDNGSLDANQLLLINNSGNNFIWRGT